MMDVCGERDKNDRRRLATTLASSTEGIVGAFQNGDAVFDHLRVNKSMLERGMIALIKVTRVEEAGEDVV
jgi:hypothetical protein